MAYSLKYTCSFDSNITTYTLEIYQKNYGGGVTSLKGGASPVVHSWGTDEPTPAIKGSSLAISLINEGTIPLLDLYSTDDEQFKAKLIWHTGITDIVMFEGFIVQDDSQEILVEYNHEITLSANDNLGLLKDIPFDQALKQKIFPVTHTVTITTTGHTIDIPLTLVAGDIFTIPGYGPFTVASVIDSDSYYTVAALPTLSGSYAIVVMEALPFYHLIPLHRVIQLCLRETGLLLSTRILSSINEITQSNTACFLEQTLIDPQTFYSGSNYDDCYSVLTKILERFNCTLFQAKGTWNIVRWPELRDYNYSIPGYYYDENFTYLSPTELNEATTGFAGWPKFLSGIGQTSQAESGLTQRISRPYKFTKETFNYQKPDQLIKNSNLQTLGTKFNDTTVGTLRKEYYQFPASPDWQHIASDNSYIVVETDTVTLNEIQRYVEQPVVNSVYPFTTVPVCSLEFNDIEVGLGDQWDLSFSYRWAANSSDYGLLNVAIFVLDSATDGYNLNDIFLTPGTHISWGHITGTYTDGFGNRLSTLILQADNKTEWRTFSVSGLITDPAFKMLNIPIGGVMKIYIYGSNSRTGGEQSGYTNENFRLKDITFDYTPLINESTKIIGHTHTSLQNIIIKNTNEKEIFIDYSPRNSIKGALFLNSLTGLVQTRVGQWNRKTRTESKNLGEITTFENLFLRRLPRTLLEGTLYGLLSVPQTAAGPTIIKDHISILTLIKYTFFPDRNFIFGRLDIDYRNNSASGTLYEMYKDTEADSDLSDIYQFLFLYAIK